MEGPGIREMLASVADADVLELHTTGRVTGSIHTVDLWFSADGDRVAFLSGGREHADWVQNLLASGEAQVTISGRRFAGSVSWAEGTAREAGVRRALAAKYQGWNEGLPLSAWARRALPVELVLARVGDGQS